MRQPRTGDMNTPAAQLSVLAGEGFACVKIQGRANFTSSIDFDAAITRLRALGFSQFVLELSECSLMDSTFLGVLAGHGLKLLQCAHDPDCPCVELRNANPRIAELLENIGVLHLFKTSEGALAAADSLEACAPPPVPASRAEVARTCLQAHEMLMAINPGNVARFKDVTRFLAEDLARHQDEKPEPTAS